MFTTTLNQTLILFLFILIGFFLRRCGILKEGASSTISKLETYIFVPALAIGSFMKRFTVENLSAMYLSILCGFALLAVFSILSFFLSPIFAKNKYETSIFRYSLTFANFGFMGNALVLGAFGEEMLFRYLLFTIPMSFAVYSVGVASLKPKFRLSFKMFLSPCFLSLIIGAFLGLSGLGAPDVMPAFLSKSIDMAGACMSPLAMILTGVVVADYRLSSLLSDRRVYICTALRLIVFPALAILGLKAVGIGNEDHILTLTLCAYATPLGLNTVIYPASYGADTKLGASMAVISHTLSVLTIPLMFQIFL